MTEVVFSNSEKGSMKAGQHFKRDTRMQPMFDRPSGRDTTPERRWHRRLLIAQRVHKMIESGELKVVQENPEFYGTVLKKAQ